MDQKIQELEKQIDSVIIESENDFSQSKTEQFKKQVQDINLIIDNLNEDQSLLKKQRGKLNLLKGKILDVLPEYNKQAEEALSKSLKLNPVDSECWNTLGHILWKKQDYINAQKMFEGAIEQCGKNAKSLRYLSIVSRCIGEGDERKKNVEKSVELAKEAVNLDFTDGESWYVVGNAYLSNFFVNMKTIDELQLSLKAYNQAERFLKKQNPDLYYNRASIYQYLEDYNKSIEQYKQAEQLDISLQTKEKIQYILSKFHQIYDLVENRGKLKQKRLMNLIQTIPTGLKNQTKNLLVPLDQLKEGVNKQTILTCKITHVISNKKDVPATFVLTDSKTNFGSLSIYNTSQEIYENVKENSDLFIVDPVLKTISITHNEITKTYRSIQIFDINKLFVDSEKITQTFSPSIVVNQTFQNNLKEETKKQEN